MQQQLLDIYRGLGHETRLRILLLLAEGPLCVQHLQQILGASQVEMSKQLAYLKGFDLVEVEKLRNWRVYSLPTEKSDELQLQLKCLQECTRTKEIFVKDRQRLKAIPELPRRNKVKQLISIEPPITEERQGLENHLL
jgi:ArsR family transcriptional regulator, arsenate/arsenite/antimonite-responsive transcriptional repressor